MRKFKFAVCPGDGASTSTLVSHGKVTDKRGRRFIVVINRYNSRRYLAEFTMAFPDNNILPHARIVANKAFQSKEAAIAWAQALLKALADSVIGIDTTIVEK